MSLTHRNRRPDGPDGSTDPAAPPVRLVGGDVSIGGRPVLRHLDLRVEHGEFVALLGANGSGKSTLVRALTGLRPLAAGTLELFGTPLDRFSDWQRVGFVPQRTGATSGVPASVREVVAAGRLTRRRLFRPLSRADRAAIDEALEVVGLTERADDRSKEFSGGMKRRLNIGIGLLHEPKLLILDEPTVGVDPQSRNAILESVEQLSTEGIAVLYTTHYMEEAERLCHRVGIIDEGMIQAEGTRRDLVALVGQNDTVRLTASGDLPRACGAAAAVSGVEAASARDGGIDVLTKDAGTVLPGLLAAVASAGAHVTGVEVVEPNLETVFLHLTGKALRD
jgi:ABC-2 type transport system ATP-binding protein